jgi:hypothetical protein
MKKLLDWYFELPPHRQKFAKGFAVIVLLMLLTAAWNISR